MVTALPPGARDDCHDVLPPGGKIGAEVKLMDHDLRTGGDAKGPLTRQIVLFLKSPRLLLDLKRSVFIVTNGDNEWNRNLLNTEARNPNLTLTPTGAAYFSYDCLFP
jgi:hypothetical protein